MRRPATTARQLIARVVDADSFVSWDTPPDRGGISEAYAALLLAAQKKSGEDESVITGEALVRGQRVALVAGEFGFLAGPIGIAASRRLIAALERATAEGITVAEPGALLGFLGPRVYEALYGEEFPTGVQTSENLFAHGLIDGVVTAEELPAIIERALAVVTAEPPATVPDPLPQSAQALAALDKIDAWTSILRSRDDLRPGVRHLLRLAASEAMPLNGTGQGESDPGLLLALARFEGAPCVLLGQDRSTQTELAPLGRGALRTARRGMRLAHELRLPLVTVIDTPGAALSPEAEEGGLAGEIARCLADLVTLESPTLTVLLGQGCGGGALALLPADRVIAAQHAWLSPLPPEGASAIVHRTPDRAPGMAREQGIRACDLLASGIVDRIVPEQPDAAEEPAEFCRRLGSVLRHELGGLAELSTRTVLARHRQRYAG